MAKALINISLRMKTLKRHSLRMTISQGGEKNAKSRNLETITNDYNVTTTTRDTYVVHGARHVMFDLSVMSNTCQ